MFSFNYLTPFLLAEIPTGESYTKANESANIGLLTLLFVTGLESDFPELIQVGTQATTVAITGVALPLALGAIAL